MPGGFDAYLLDEVELDLETFAKFSASTSCLSSMKILIQILEYVDSIGKGALEYPVP